MDYLKAPQRGKILGWTADALRGAKTALNYPGKIPVIDQGLGDLAFGQGPEFVDDLSYGMSPIKGGGGIGGTATLDRRALDLAMAPGMASAPALLRKGAKAAIPAAATNVGRREFMKKAGALGAAGVAASMTPDVAKLAVKALKAAPTTVAKEVAPKVVVSAARTWTPELMTTLGAKFGKHMGGEFDPHVPRGLWDEVPQNVKDDLFASVGPDEAERLMASQANLADYLDDPELMKLVENAPIGTNDAVLVATKPIEQWKHLFPEATPKELEFIQKYWPNSDAFAEKVLESGHPLGKAWNAITDIWS